MIDRWLLLKTMASIWNACLAYHQLRQHPFLSSMKWPAMNQIQANQEFHSLQLDRLLRQLDSIRKINVDQLARDRMNGNCRFLIPRPIVSAPFLFGRISWFLHVDKVGKSSFNVCVHQKKWNRPVNDFCTMSVELSPVVYGLSWVSATLFFSSFRQVSLSSLILRSIGFRQINAAQHIGLSVGCQYRSWRWNAT